MRSSASNSSVSHALTLHISPAVNYSKKLFTVYLLCRHSPWTALQGHKAFLLAASWVFLYFLFYFGSVFFLFVLLEVRRREEPQRQAAKGVSGTGLSNGFADTDSRNCCLLLCQEQPIRRQVLKVETVQASNLLTCIGLQEKACACACVLWGNLLIKCNNL